MRAGDKGARLVKADVAVLSKPQKLQVRAAKAFYLLIIGSARGFPVRGHPVRHKSVRLVDIDMIEELMVHEIPVALFICPVQPSVFIQIDRSDRREIKIAALIRFDQFLICSDRCGAGREPQNAVRLLKDQGADHGGCPAAYCCIVFFSVDSHLYMTPLPLKNSALFCVLNLLYHGLLF